MKKKKKDIFSHFLTIIACILAMMPIFKDLKLSYYKNESYNKFTANLNLKEEKKDSSKVSLKTFDLDILGVLYIPKVELSMIIYDSKGVDEKESIEKMEMGESNGASLWYMLDDLDFKKNSRSLLSSHNGLSSKDLFTNLEDLSFNDKFYIKDKNGKIHAYKVFEIDKTKPDGEIVFKDILKDENVLRYTKNKIYEINKNSYEGYKTIINNEKSLNEEVLNPFYKIADKNLVTLQTCVPIFQNTHRLLVTGEEIPYKGESLEYKNNFKKYLIIFSILSIILLVSLILMIRNIIINSKIKSLDIVRINIK